MVTLTKEDFIAKRKHCFCIAACFLLLVTPYLDVTCTCVTRKHVKCYVQCKNQSLPHFLSFDLVLTNKVTLP